MSPQRSNRSALIEGTLRCLECLPPERVTARAIAAESGANLASIAYHFGTKDKLITETVITGLDRWLAEIEGYIGDAASRQPVERMQLAGEAIAASRRGREGLTRNFVSALARAQFDDAVRAMLVAGFEKTRPALAGLLGLGDDQSGEDAGGLVHSLFVGLLFASLLDPRLAIEGERMVRAQARLKAVLPGG